MPKATPSAASAFALQTALPPPNRMTSDAMGEAGSRDALKQLSAAMAELKALAVQPLLQRAIDALMIDDHATGAKWAIQALEKDERNGFAWYLLAVARERAGDFASSVQAYELALTLLPEHGEIANDLGRLAYRMGMKGQAEKLFRHFLGCHPDHPEGANNLACALRDQRRYDEAIDVLRAAILKTPEMAMLWNTMATVVGEQGDFPTAEIFLREALRLQPEFPKARYNFGNARLMQGDAEGALEACEAALAAGVPEDERQMMRLARSTILIALGRIGEGWDEYEARLHPLFADATLFRASGEQWRPGTDLAGKSLAVIGEQGLGDEVLFANALPDVAERLGPDGKLTIAVERRLAPLFQRSFPQARVGLHATADLGGRALRGLPFVEEDEPPFDLWAPMASLLCEFRRELSQFPTDRVSYLKPDPAGVAHWRDTLAALPGRKVGLLWKSASDAGARHRYFSPFERWGSVVATKGVSFVNLQYGDCSDELAWVRKALGVEVWQPPGIDLKQDLDDVAALGCALDLVVGFSNASFNLAAACGAPAWLITTPGAWPRLGTERGYPWYPQVRVFASEAIGDWSVMDEVADALGAFAADAER